MKLRASQIGPLAACGLVVTAAGWIMVVVVVSQHGLYSVDLFWLPVGFMISAVGISLFLLAASIGSAKGTPRITAVLVLGGFAVLLGYGLLGPFGGPEQESRLAMVESFGYLVALPAFLSLQIGLVSVVRNHPSARYRTLAGALAAIYAVILVISFLVLSFVLDGLFGGGA